MDTQRNDQRDSERKPADGAQQQPGDDRLYDAAHLNDGRDAANASREPFEGRMDYNLRTRRESNIQIRDMQDEVAADQADASARRSSDSPESLESTFSDNGAAARHVRKRRGIKALIAVLVVVVAAAVVVGCIFFFRNNVKPGTQDDVVTIENVITHQSGYLKSLFNKVTGLVSLQGLAARQVQDELVDDYVLTGSGDGILFQPLGDQTLTWMTFAGISSATQGVTNLALWFDTDGKVVGVELTEPLSMLQSDNMSFADLVATSSALEAALKQCGIEEAVTTYTAPSESSYTTYVDANADPKVVSRYSSTVKGTSPLDEGFDNWSVQFTYDYRQVQEDGSMAIVEQPTKTVQVRLW